MREIKILLTISFALMPLSLFPLSANAADISLGVETHVPPFVWKDGLAMEDFPSLTADHKITWKSVEAEISEYGKWGAQWNVITVYQGSSGPGQLLWLRRVIETHRKNGLDVALRFMEDPSVYKNLAQTASSESGYNKNYYEWVRSVAQVYGKQTIYYLIGNETEQGIGEHVGPGEPKSPVTYEQYRKLLATAVKAIKSVNAELMVANCGFSDYPLVLAVMDDIYRRQGVVDAQAFWAKWKKSGGKQVEGLLGVYRLLHSAETQRMISFVRQAIRDPAGSDVLQLHYYGGWEALPTMLQWVYRQMQESQSVRPIVAAEVGFYVQSSLVKEGSKSYWQMDVNRFTPTEHAENTVKNFAILLGSDTQRVLYWNMRLRNRKGTMVVPLFEPTQNPTEFVPTSAANAYKVLANMLNGLAAATPRLGNIEGLWHFHFTGGRDVTLVWATHPMQITLPPGVKEVTDMYGKPLEMGAQLQIDSHPVYLLWGTDRPKR